MPRVLPAALSALAFAAVSLGPGAAWACGVSSPDGASLCALAAGQGPKWRASLSGIYTATRLRFSDGMRGDETRAGVVAALSYQLSPRLAIQGGLGPSFGGAFEAPNGRHAFLPGVLGLVGTSYRVYGGPAHDENGEGVNQDPFIILTSVLAFNVTHTTHENGAGSSAGRTLYHAYDLRLGGVIGVTIADRLRPYALGRVFGGPIFWRYEEAAVTGTEGRDLILSGNACRHWNPDLLVGEERRQEGDEGVPRMSRAERRTTCPPRSRSPTV